MIATTAAREPLPAELFRSAIHVTGVGTDMPGKGELPVEVFAGALVATDDHAQCLDHGDFGNAVRAGVVADDVDLAVGAVLRDGVDRTRRSVADLTGIGAADAAVAAAVLEQHWSDCAVLSRPARSRGDSAPDRAGRCVGELNTELAQLSA